MSELPEIIKKYMASFSDDEKNDFMDTDEELVAFSEFMLAKEKASQKDLTGTNDLEEQDVPRAKE